MNSPLGPHTTLGYCTNVHAGANWEQTRANLERHALGVKERFSPNEPMGVGLWLSARSAREVLERVGIDSLRAWLGEKGLKAFTFNGFPHGDFHQPQVKHRVYRPDWSETARLDYTFDLIEILAGLLEPGEEGSLSTLPLGWGKGSGGSTDLAAAATHLRSVAERLRVIEDSTGKLIHLNLEPEPGCLLDRCEDAISFFKEHLLPNGEERTLLRHLRVCHDICHSAVMFEDQAGAFAAYASAGVLIGKVQISSAIRLDFEPLSPTERKEALDRLTEFREDRYLHQTVVRYPEDRTVFYEDLPEAIEAIGRDPRGEARVHFHVPLFLDRIGPIETTQHLAREGLRILRSEAAVRHYEVETYAWGVLPEDLRTGDLSEGVAREMQWVKDTVSR